MKLLENAALESLCTFVREHARNLNLDITLEPYSCKMVSTDKREWRKSMLKAGDAQELQPLAPPDNLLPDLSSSPFGRYNQSGRLRHTSEASCSRSDNETDEKGVVTVGVISRKTLFFLTSALNVVYNDYDFSGTKSENFTTISIAECIADVDAKFEALVNDFSCNKSVFWKSLDDEIVFNESVVYSFISNGSGDPFTEDGCIWAFNYLFFNKSKNRILFFGCRAFRPQSMDASTEELWLDED